MFTINEIPSNIPEFATVDEALRAGMNLGTYLVTGGDGTTKRAWRMLGDCLEVCFSIESDWVRMEKMDLQGAHSFSGRTMDWSLPLVMGADPESISRNVW